VTTRIWMDSHGQVFEAPADARTCHDAAGKPQTHYLWQPDDPHVLVPQTVCGQRAGTIPGSGDVDCPDCLATDETSALASD
jgi:hypothetical protein